jgi:hypothetical protein
MPRYALLALSCLTTACGAATSATHTETRAPAEAWNAARCPPETFDVHVVGRSGSTQYVLAGTGRYRIDASGMTPADTVTTDALVAAAKIGEGPDAAWYFTTNTGVILSAGDDFLGPLEQVSEIGGPPAGVIDTNGVLAFARSSQRSISLFAGEDVIAIDSPDDALILGAAVHWPDRIALFLEPGRVVLSTDQGQSFHDVSLDRMPIGIGADADRVWLRWIDTSESELRADGTITTTPTPPEEAEHAAVPTDAWCGSRFIPLGLRTSWPEGTLDDIDAGRGCTRRQGDAALVSLCADSGVDHTGSHTVQRFDEATHAYVEIGHLEDADPDFEVADAPGSASFAVLFHGSDRADHAAYYDGQALTPVTIARRLSSVHGALGITAANYDPAPPALWHLPDAAPVPLALPVNDAVHRLAFAADGSLIVVTHGEGGDTLWLGTPGTWRRRTVPAGVHQVGMADPDHGVAPAADDEGATGAFVTNDGGERWTPFAVGSPEDRFMSDEVLCLATGCTIGDTITFRGQPARAEATVVDTSRDAYDTRSYSWNFARSPIWDCAPPTETSFDHDQDVVLRPWGFLDAHATDATSVSWSGADARGVYHSHASLPEGAHFLATVVMTRRYAVGYERGSLVVASQSPHTISLTPIAGDLVGALGEISDTAVLDDGSTLLTLATSGGAVRYELVVHLDANGALAGSRSFAWSTVEATRSGLAAGPHGVVGRVQSGSEEDRDWVVYPLDHSAPPIHVSGALDTQLACTATTRPWTLVTMGPARLDSGDDVTNVLRVGDDGGCVSAALGARLESAHRDGSGVYVRSARASRGQVHGLALDRSPHGHALTCTITNDSVDDEDRGDDESDEDDEDDEDDE